MSKILLTCGPDAAQLQAIRTLMEGEGGEPTTHLRFRVSVDGVEVPHPNGGINRAPKLLVRLSKVPGSVLLTRQHLPLSVEVLEDFAGRELMMDGVDVGKAGTKLELQYSFVDYTTKITRAEAPKKVNLQKQG